MPFGLGRKNSNKNLENANTAPVAAAPVVGRSYELPAEPVAAAVLPGKTYELPADNLQTAHHNPLDRNHDGRVDLKDLNTRDRNHDGIPDNLERNQGLGLNQGLGVNPLDRNGDGILDSQQGLGLGQTAYVQSAQRASLGVVRAEPTVIETIQKDVVVQERIHPVMKEEIQPVIYREREQLDVRQVTQMMHETQIQPTIIENRELAAEVRAPIVERGAPIAENIVLPSVQRDATLRTEVVHAPIIEETIRKTVIEEIQPVLERDVFVPTVVQNTQPIYEKIVEAPTVYREVREVQELGTRSIGEYPVAAPIVAAPVPVLAAPIVAAPAPLTVVPITTTTIVETYDHKMNPIETRDFVNNRGLPLR